MEVALQWCSDGYSDNLVGFVNSVKTLDGGTHLDGLKAALTRTLNAVGRKARPSCVARPATFVLTLPCSKSRPCIWATLPWRAGCQKCKGLAAMPEQHV